MNQLQLGNRTYNRQELQSILQQPVRGNGLISLAYQEIAAKLNIANGADPTPVAGDIAAADGIIGNLVPPSVGSDTLLPSDVEPFSTNLDNYNNGNSGVPHCGNVKTQTVTWGSLKGIYH